MFVLNSNCRIFKFCHRFAQYLQMLSSTSNKKVARQDIHRIFVNRSLQLGKIRFYGFDMDYTLACYKSPDFEELCFTLTRDVLIDYGYPEEFKKFEFESFFPLRGLWFDREYGTFLKTDQYGNILVAMIGFQYLKTQEIIKLYPNKFMKFDETRVYVMNTLFSLAEMYLLARVIHWFTSNPNYIKSDKGVLKDNVFMTYHSIMQDVRDATDFIHTQGKLKQETVENLKKYVHVHKHLPVLLDRIRNSSSKTFLLTNSEFDYTQKIMTYLLSFPDKDNNIRNWTTYFDYIVVDAKKPKFFLNGSILRAVDKYTGKMQVGQHVGPLKVGQIYSGGSCEVFSQLIGSHGKDVLYVGDHIFGDILKSKKIVGWRTYLVIPELNHELHVWQKEQNHFEEIIRLDNHLEEIYKNHDIHSMQAPDVKMVKDELKQHAKEMELSYGALGSLFRNGSRLTFFSSQVQRYADIYSSTCINLIYYPLWYMFRSIPMLLSHENIINPLHDMDFDSDNLEIEYYHRSVPKNSYFVGNKKFSSESDIEIEKDETKISDL